MGIAIESTNSIETPETKISLCIQKGEIAVLVAFRDSVSRVT